MSCTLSVFAKPRARRSRLVGLRGEVLEVALAAPPVDGAANEELVRFLAASLDLPGRAVRLVRGAGGRNKRVEVDGLTAADLAARLGELLRSSST